jgi:hypothetical protein
MVSRKTLINNLIAAAIFVVIAVVIFYVFSHHYVLIDTCGSNRTLVVSTSGPECLPNLNSTMIVYGKPYTINSSLAASDGEVIPLDFRFIGENPLFFIWNQNVSYPAGSYSFFAMPDTFKVHMQYTSNVETEFIIMTDSQYVNWVNAGESGSNGVYSITGKSVSVWFNDSAGCAGYVAVIKAVSGGAFSISPNETALYDPASAPTGVCA